MTSNQRLVSCLLVAHLAALFIAAIPGVDLFGTETIARAAAEPVTQLTAGIDAAADDIIWLHRVLRAVTEPVRRPVVAYIRIVALFQRWDMFADPSRVHAYARVGYRMRMESGTISTEYEQIFPSGPTGVWKFGSAYFDSFMDKAMSTAIQNYLISSKRARAAGDPIPTDEMVEGLLPYTHYFGHRRLTTGLPPGAQMTAVEFWYGSAPAPPPPPLAGQPSVERPTGQPPAINWQRWVVDEWQ